MELSKLLSRSFAFVFAFVYERSMSDTGVVSYIGVGTIAFVNIVILENLISGE